MLSRPRRPLPSLSPALAAASFGGLALLSYTQNNIIGVSEHDYVSDRVPQSFDGFRILHLSDLHNKRFGRNQRVLLNKINQINPDIIVITGDIINSRHFDLSPVVELISKLTPHYPVYFVHGNHEARENFCQQVKGTLLLYGVHILEDRSEKLRRGNDVVELHGISDPNFSSEVMVENYLRHLSHEHFSILLSHRPELIDIFADIGMDLVFSGHTHGGQWRLPFVGGLVAPHQGVFPKYDAGRFEVEGTTLFISRGLGTSYVPQRILNQPELIVVTLRRD